MSLLTFLYRKLPAPSVRTINGDHGAVLALAVTPDSRYFVGGGQDGTVCIREIETGELVRESGAHGDSVVALALDPAGEHVITGGKDAAVQIWRVPDSGFSGELEHVRTLEGHTGTVRSVVVTPDGKRIISAGGSRDNTIRVWDFETGTLQTTLDGHTSAVTSVAAAPDSRHIVSASVDKSVRVWDLDPEPEDGGEEEVPEGVDPAVLAALDEEMRAKILGRVGGGGEANHLKRTLSGHSGWVQSVAICREGYHIISAGGLKDERLLVWRMGDGEQEGTLAGHGGEVTCVATTPDGRFIVSGSADRTLRVWRMRDGVFVRELEGHTDVVQSVAVTPNGKWILSGGGYEDGSVRVWRAPTSLLAMMPWST